MKAKIFAAIAIAAASISLASCDWLFGKKQIAKEEKSIVGKWKIESIADSSKNKTSGLSILAIALSAAKDSSLLAIEFKPDSSFSVYSKVDTTTDSGKYYIDSSKQILFVKDDSVYEPLLIKNWSDSSVAMYSGKDSVYYRLKK